MQNKLELLAELAHERYTSKWAAEHNYLQPENFDFDFRDHISPNAKSAGNPNASVFVVLQDWGSDEAIEPKRGSKVIAEHGYDPLLKTNKHLIDCLARYMRMPIEEVYVTNVFPFIKRGKISDAIRLSHLRHTARQFTLREIAIVQPRVVLALGRGAELALTNLVAVDKLVPLPHPAARLGNLEVAGRWAEAAQRLGA